MPLQLTWLIVLWPGSKEVGCHKLGEARVIRFDIHNFALIGYGEDEVHAVCMRVQERDQVPLLRVRKRTSLR